VRIFCLSRLLEDPRAIKEIEHYKWIESERLGMDIGEKRAVMEWISHYGCYWLMTHRRDKYQAMLEEMCQEEKGAAPAAQQVLCGASEKV
jgi:hypothetical protein